MDITLVLLGIFVGGILLTCIIASIFQIKENREQKRKYNRLRIYYNYKGKKDITLLEKFMKENLISFPKTKFNSVEYVKNCLNNIKEHFKNKFVYKNLEKAGFSRSRSCRLDNCGQVFYDQNYVLIFHELFNFLTFLFPEENNGLVTYHYRDDYDKDHYLSLIEVFRRFEKLKNPNFYKEFATILPKKDIYWYVKDEVSVGYKLGKAGTGAVFGGLLLGPAGAILGAANSRKTIENAEKNRTIIFGEKSKRYWIVSNSPSSFESIFDLLIEHFPNHRLSDSYSK